MRTIPLADMRAIVEDAPDQNVCTCGSKSWI
jgi:hypothetical protein